MEKQYTNYSDQTIIKRQGGGVGTLRILEFKDPAAPEESLTFFIEIETSDKENERIVRILSEELRDQFFNAPTDSVEFAFENALSRANIAIKDTLLIKPKNWLNKIHVAILACKDQEVHLSSVGSTHAFLVHRDQIVDVLDGGGKTAGAHAAERGYSARTPNPVKLFSNITSGRLLPNDALVLINESVLDYLSPERIRKTAMDFEPATAANKFHELLSAAPANKQFGVVVIKRLPMQDLAVQKQERQAEEKLEKEIAVEKYLKPSAPSSIESKQTALSAMLLEGGKKLSVSLLEALAKYGQIGLALTLNFLSKFLEKAQLKLADLLPIISRSPAFLKTFISDSEARNYHGAKIKQWFIFKKQALANYFRSLPWRQKRVLAAIVGLVIILTGSICLRIYNNNQTEKKAAFKKEITALGQQIDQTEAALLYNDQARAREILAAVKNRLSNLLANNGGNNADQQALQKRISDLENKLDKKIVLNDLTAIATLNPGSDDTSGLILTDTTTLYYNGNQKQLFRLDIQSGLLSPFTALADKEPFKQAVLIDSKTLALLAESAAMLADIEKETVASQDFSFPANHPEPFTGYARNLYTFSRAAKTVTRYREGSFNKADNWLKQDYDLSKMTDIIVDGSLYLLSEDGKIHVLSSGYPTTTIELNLSQPLGNGAKFYLSEDVANFYVLDSANNRLLKFTRKGELLGQYISPSLKEARELIVPKGETEAIILSGDKIYRLPLTVI